MRKRVRVLTPMLLAVMALSLTVSQAPAAYQPGDPGHLPYFLTSVPVTISSCNAQDSTSRRSGIAAPRHATR